MSENPKDPVVEAREALVEKGEPTADMFPDAEVLEREIAKYWREIQKVSGYTEEWPDKPFPSNRPLVTAKAEERTAKDRGTGLYTKGSALGYF